MLYILGIIALLTLTIADSEAPNALTPAQINAGRVEGFHARPELANPGDYLLNTYCFCAPPSPVPDHHSQTNYFQVEYYNAHQNNTYILAHTGLTFRICRTWYNGRHVPGRRERDELCYDTNRKDNRWRQYRLPGHDKIHFNKQTRNLDTVGRMGPLLWGREESERRCEIMCMDHVGMTTVKDDDMAASHLISWEDLDDMCEGCN